MENVALNENANNKDNFDTYISSLKKSDKKLLIVILGLNKFLTEWDDTKRRFYQSLKEAKESGKCNFVLVEVEKKLKGYEYEPWYKEFVQKNDGIWVGDGVDNQYSISISSDRRELKDNCGRSFGYMVKREKATLIKLVGLQEEGEEDE